MAEAANLERRKEAIAKRKGLYNVNTSSSPTKAPADSSSSSKGKVTKIKRETHGQVCDILTRAWTLVREQSQIESQKNWSNLQKEWIAKQKKAEIEDTSWLLKL